MHPQVTSANVCGNGLVLFQKLQWQSQMVGVPNALHPQKQFKGLLFDLAFADDRIANWCSKGLVGLGRCSQIQLISEPRLLAQVHVTLQPTEPREELPMRCLADLPASLQPQELPEDEAPEEEPT